MLCQRRGRNRARGMIVSARAACQPWQVFMYSGYITAWVIYIGYLLLLMNKLMKLKAEAAELER